MNKIHPQVLARFGRDPEIIFKRDNWKCIICKTNKDLTIDHIDGNGRHSKKPNNNIDNLRTLCRKCHGSIDGKRGGCTTRMNYFNPWDRKWHKIKRR